MRMLRFILFWLFHLKGMGSLQLRLQVGALKLETKNSFKVEEINYPTSHIECVILLQLVTTSGRSI